MTLCHHDAVAANLFVRDGETVAIDWEMLGIGPIGTDLASLLFSSVRRGDLAVAAYPELEPLAMEAYLAGMRDMSARVDPAMVRLGFNAAIALRWSLARDVVAALVDGTDVHRGSAPDEPPERALDELIGLTGILFEAARRTATPPGTHVSSRR
jgi:aminoglycoside phosphotransferase (APT) family kinase protein